MIIIKICVILAVISITEGFTRRYPELQRRFRVTLRFSFCLILLAAIHNVQVITGVNLQ